MAVNVGTVEVLLELRDLLKQQAAQTATVLSRLEKAATQTTTATNNLGKSHDRSASSIDKFGRQIKTTLVHVLAAGAAYKVLGAAVDSIGKSVEFVRTFEKIENVTGVARVEVERLRSSINELSTATGKGPQELAEGFYFIASAGLKGAEAVEVLTQAARASAVGLGETDVIARSITSALNAYGKENLSAAQAANQLFVTVREGGAEASEVAGVFGRIVGIASEMGVSFAEVGASIATFTRLGVGADEAVTALRGTLSTLLKPDKQTREAINELAFAFGRVTMSAAELREEIKQRGLADVLITLNKAAGGNVEVMGRLVPNVRALAGVLGNTGQQADAYREILQKMTSDTGALDTAFVDVSKSASHQWDVLTAQLEQLALAFGEKLLPAIVKLGDTISELDSTPVMLIAESFATIADMLADVLTAWEAIPAPLRDFLTGKVALGQLQAFNAQRNREGRGKRVTDFFSSLLDDDVYGSTERLNEAAFKAAAQNQREVLKLTKEEVAFREHAREMIEKYNKELEKQEGNQRDITEEQKKEAEQRAKAAAALAQRGAEVLNNLRNQAAVAAEQLALANARAAGDKAAIAAIEEQLVNREIQLEVERTIASLDNQKAQASRELRAEIEAQVAARIRDEEAAKKAEETLRRQTVEIRNQQTLEEQLVRIAIDRREAEEATRQALRQQGEALQQQLVDAHDQIDNTREYLSALVSGGREAARIVELQQQYLKEYGNANTEMAQAIAAAETEQEKLNYLIAQVGELAKPAWQIYYDAAFSVIDSIGNALSDAIVEAGMTGKVEWENIWESLKQTLLQIFADMLAEMLKRWITTQLAMRAASQSINAGSGNTTGGGGGLIGSLVNMGMTAGASGGASGGAGMSANALAAWGFAAYALFIVYKGFIEDHKAKFSRVTIGDQGQIVAQAAHTQKYIAGLLAVVEGTVKNLRQWLDDINIEMIKFGQVTIQSDKSGFHVGSQRFATAAEAISAAMAFMIKFGEFADSVPMLVQAAVRASDINMESITSNVAFARQLLTQNMEDIGLAIYDSTELFLDQMRRSFELFGQVGRNFNPQALMEATGSAILYFTNSLQELYNQLTGHKEDPRQAAERQRQAYNLQRAIMIAQITLLLEEVRARVAVVQAQIAMLNALRNTPGYGGEHGGGPGGGTGDPTSEGPGNAPGSGSGVGRGKGGGMLVFDERNPTNNPQLAALLQVLDSLARALAGLPPEIGEGGVRPGRRGGGGGRAQGVRDFIDEQRFQLAQAGRSPLQQEIESIRRSFAEQLEAAGKNVKLRQELLALEQQAIQAARERFQEDVQNRFKEITGQTNSFTELRKRFNDMRRDILDAGFAAERMGEMMRDLARAEADAVRVLSSQMAADLLGGLAQYIEDENVRVEFLKAAAIIKFNLDMANYKAQFAILRAQGALADDVLKTIQDAIDYIERHPPTFPGTGSGGGSGNTATPPPFTGTYVGERTVWDGWVWTWNGTNWIQGNQHIPPQGGGGTGGGTGSTTGESIRRAQELLQRYRDEGMNQWQRALTELNRDFEEIRHWLGNTPEVAQAYADALHRLREEFLEGIRDYYNELRNFGASQSVAQQFAAAQSRYQQLLGMVQGGDLSQAGALQQAAAQLEQLAQQMFGTATGGYQDIRSQILADLEAILGIVSPNGNNVIGGPEWFASGNAASIAATTHVADVVSLSGASRDAWLQRIDEKLGRLVGDPAEPIDPDAAPFSYGDWPRWGGGRK